MSTLNPVEAYQWIQSGAIAQLKGRMVSTNFSWAEAFTQRTDAQIRQVTAIHLLNIYAVAHQMEAVRAFLGARSITVTSWWRDAQSNQQVGGASQSKHLTGEGIDFTVAGLSPQQVQQQLDGWWPGGLGYGSTFTHLDIRPQRVRFGYG